MHRVLCSSLATVLLVVSFGGRANAREVGEFILNLVESGNHPDLQRHDLADVKRDLEALYLTVGYAPLWFHDGRVSQQGRTVVTEIAAADQRGLRPQDYDSATLAERVARFGDSDDPAEVARTDTAISAALLRFARDMYFGRTDPRKFGFGLDTVLDPLDLAAIGVRVSIAQNVEQEIATLDPPFPLFGRLQKALATYRDLQQRQDLAEIPELGGKLRPGDSHPSIPAIRARLLAFDDLAPYPKPLPHPQRYDEAMVAGVKHFQARHGLLDDGVIGAGTSAALRVPIATRVKQIELAMERLRWLPRRADDRFLIVNIPEFKLSAFERDHVGSVLSSGVVVGSAAQRSETPIFRAEMTYIVFRPYWNVPTKIRDQELLPKARRDPEYLKRQNMEFAKNGRLRQRPGADNALGLIKFMLPNRYNVYLHDTPSKDLFRRTRRDFSHGCIRVARPVDLAEFVLRGQGDWTKDRILQAMQSGPDNRHVTLQHPIAVYLLYSTVVASREGEVRFFEDIYGHDAELETAIAKAAP